MRTTPSLVDPLLCVPRVPQGPCLVELNARCHGGDGSWVPLAKALTGYSQVDAVLDAAIDPKAFQKLPQSPRAPFAAAGQEVLIVSRQSGRLVRTPGFDVARTLTSFVSLEAFVAAGDMIERTVDVFTQAASIVLVHHDEHVVAADVETLRSLESEAGGMFEVVVDFLESPPATRRPAPPTAPSGQIHTLAFSSPFVSSALRLIKPREAPIEVG